MMGIEEQHTVRYRIFLGLAPLARDLEGILGLSSNDFSALCASSLRSQNGREDGYQPKCGNCHRSVDGEYRRYRGWYLHNGECFRKMYTYDRNALHDLERQFFDRVAALDKDRTKSL